MIYTRFGRKTRRKQKDLSVGADKMRNRTYNVNYEPRHLGRHYIERDTHTSVNGKGGDMGRMPGMGDDVPGRKTRQRSGATASQGL